MPYEIGIERAEPTQHGIADTRRPTITYRDIETITPFEPMHINEYLTDNTADDIWGSMANLRAHAAQEVSRLVNARVIDEYSETSRALRALKYDREILKYNLGNKVKHDFIEMCQYAHIRESFKLGLI